MLALIQPHELGFTILSGKTDAKNIPPNFGRQAFRQATFRFFEFVSVSYKKLINDFVLRKIDIPFLEFEIIFHDIIDLPVVLDKRRGQSIQHVRRGKGLAYRESPIDLPRMLHRGAQETEKQSKNRAGFYSHFSFPCHEYRSSHVIKKAIVLSTY
jgi:hypothetical protein